VRTVGGPDITTPSSRRLATARFRRVSLRRPSAKRAHLVWTASRATKRFGALAFEDPVIAVSGGQATADAIPGAELVVIDGMGHDLPRPLWPTVAERITALVARAQQRRRSTSTSVS
jgi:pimeloyl-ACP methyl ester carboxylesterase